MIDMHVHSNSSDGSFSPSELVDEAIKQNLYAFALTDHDTLDGLEEMLTRANKMNYRHAIPGVELSAHHQNLSVHICGLFIDYNNRHLNESLKFLRKKRHERNLAILEKLSSLGFQISMQELESCAKGESVGRPHIASILVSKGYFKNIQEVFDKLLKRGEPAYVEREAFDPELTINLIRNSGGIAIWAHPFATKNLDRVLFRKALHELKEMGLQGIEAYYSTYDTQTTEYLLQVAKEEKLLISGGSDFHGKNMDGINMGIGYGNLNIPDHIFDLLSETAGKI